MSEHLVHRSSGGRFTWDRGNRSLSVPRVLRLITDGYATDDGDRVRLTDSGKAELDAYMLARLRHIGAERNLKVVA